MARRQPIQPGHMTSICEIEITVPALPGVLWIQLPYLPLARFGNTVHVVGAVIRAALTLCLHSRLPVTAERVSMARV